MNNRINYVQFPLEKRKNSLNLDRFVFYKKQGNPANKINTILYTKLSQTIIEDVKQHLRKPEYADVLLNSFGNTKKPTELHSIILDLVSSEEFNNLYKSQISRYSPEELTTILLEKIVGLDILQPLVDDENITDIKILNYKHIRVDHITKGKYKTDIQFDSHEHYLELISRFTFSDNKSLNFSTPSVDVSTPLMRTNIVGQDISTKVTMHIRKIHKHLRYDQKYLVESIMPPLAYELIKLAFPVVSNLISGSTGTGKTESMRFFTQYVPDDKDLIMIEDTPETFLDELYPDKSITMWKNRETSEEEKERFNYSYHIRNALRQNPDYIFIQESRGKEAFDIVDAANTDHIVSSTLHGNNCNDSLERFVSLCQRNIKQSEQYYRKLISKSFKIVLHFKRDNKRRVLNEICEVIGYNQDGFILKPIVTFNENTKEHEIKNSISLELWNKLQAFHENYGTDLSTILELHPTVDRGEHIESKFISNH